MADISGASGALTFDSTEIAMTNTTITKTTDTLDTTDSSHSGWETNIPREIVAWEGSADGWFKTGVADPSMTTQATIIVAMDGSRNYTGTATITSVGVAIDIPGTTVVTKSLAFKGSGALTLTNA